MLGRIWRRWNWLDEAALPLLGALMWSAWVAPPVNGLMRLMTSDDGIGGVGWMALALLLGGTFTVKVARRSSRGRWLVACGGLLAVIASEWWLLYRVSLAFWNIHWLAALADQTSHLALAPLAVVGISAFLWWRGMTANWTSHDSLARGFVFGVVVLGLSFAFFASRSPHMVTELPLDAALFLAAAWGVLSLAGVQAASRSAKEETSTLQLNRYWLLAVVAVVAAIFGAGLLLAGLLTPRVVSTLLAALQPIWMAIVTVLLYLLFAVSYVVFLILTPLMWLLHRLTQGGKPQPFTLPPPITELLKDQASGSAALSPTVELILRGLFVVGLLLLIGLLFAWALRRYASMDEEGVRESRELIWSWDLIRRQLASLLTRRQHMTRPLFGPLDKADPHAVVRDAYRRVLALAIQQEQPRLPGQTAFGYLPTLVALWPDEAHTLEALTRAYTAARYGQWLPSEAEISDLRRGLERIVASSRPQKDHHARSS